MKSLEGKIILITGAGGFIGCHLVDRLSKVKGARLLLLSRTVKDTPRDNITWLTCKLEQLTPQFWALHNISHLDYVFHLGGFTPKTPQEANRIDEIIASNVEGTRMLLRSLKNICVKIIFSSTLDVYAPSDSEDPLNEASRIAPGTLYGASKFFCESLVAAWAQQNNSEFSVLRYGHIYGPGEEKYGKLIPVVIRNLLSGQAPCVHGDGSALRDYLYVEDAVEATIRAALVPCNADPINVVRGQSTTLQEIVKLLVRLVGKNQTITYLPEKPNGPSFRFDNSQLKGMLGEWPMTPLSEGLKAEVESFMGCENGPH